MEVAQDVYEFRSTTLGKSVFIIGGTHGNEETGVAVVECLRSELEEMQLRSGIVRLALGNPRAVAEGQRFSSGGTDLNKNFTDDVLLGTDAKYESARARVLAPYIRESDIVIDIHSTLRQTATAFISSKIDPDHEAVYAWLAELTPVVIEDPDYVFAGEPASVDEYADVVGNIGICFETGYAKDVSKVQDVTTCIRNLMRAIDVLDGFPLEQPAPAFKRYRWQESIPYDAALGWRWAPDITVQSFEFIPSGTVFGYEGDEPISRPYDSYLLFPKTDELMQIEGRVGYLAVAIH